MAEDIFSFYASGIYFQLDLFFDGTATSGSILSIGGSVGADPITTLSSYNGPDNVFSLTPPYVDYDGISFDTEGGDQINLYNLNGTNVVISQGDSVNPSLLNDPFSNVHLLVLCYRRGTRILTPTGERPVEDLRIGDLVVTRFSGLQPVRWMARQSYSLRFVRGNPDRMPVRIAAGALGENLPARDLFVSPGHSMLIGDTLVLARNLINGITITQELDGDDSDQLDYFQIELDHHDCIIAEGTFSETYADAPGLRGQFHNEAEFWALYPEHCPAEELTLCAPRPEKGVKLWAALEPVVALTGQCRSPGSLRGFIDIAEGFRLEGWAMDESHPDLPVLLDISVEDKLIATALAADYRADLRAAGKGRGNCAFALNLPIRLRPEMIASLSVRRHEDGAELRGRSNSNPRISAKSA